jgi:hypothetical protein
MTDRAKTILLIIAVIIVAAIMQIAISQGVI